MFALKIPRRAFDFNGVRRSVLWVYWHVMMRGRSHISPVIWPRILRICCVRGLPTGDCLLSSDFSCFGCNIPPSNINSITLVAWPALWTVLGSSNSRLLTFMEHIYGIRHGWVRWWNFKFPSCWAKGNRPQIVKRTKGQGHKPAGMYPYLYLSSVRRMLRLELMLESCLYCFLSAWISCDFSCVCQQRKQKEKLKLKLKLEIPPPHSFSPLNVCERAAPSNLADRAGESEMGMTFASNRFPFPNRIIYAAAIKVKLSSDCERTSIWDMGFHICLLNISAWPWKGYRNRNRNPAKRDSALDAIKTKLDYVAAASWLNPELSWHCANFLQQ